MRSIYFSIVAIVLTFGNRSLADQTYAANEKRILISTERGVTLPVLLTKPLAAPTDVVVLFSGDDGLLGLTSTAITKNMQNFVVRTRQSYAKAGFITLLVDAPSDHPNGIGDDYRTGQAEVADIESLLEWIKGRWNIPIWLIGTSRGTISIANVAAQIGGEIDGLILTSSITAGKRATLYDIPLGKISTPVLLVHHEQDGCPASPYSNVSNLQMSLSGTPIHTLVSIKGGGPVQGGPCGALSYHGFVGSDDSVLSSIVNFISN